METDNDTNRNGDMTSNSIDETQNHRIIDNEDEEQSEHKKDSPEHENGLVQKLNDQLQEKLTSVDNGNATEAESSGQGHSKVEELEDKDPSQLSIAEYPQDLKVNGASIDVVIKDGSDDNENDDSNETVTDSTKGMTGDVSISRGPYKLADLINDIKLQNADIPESDNAFITCVEAWDSNFYVGTSAGELIHLYKVGDCTGAEVETEKKEECGYIQLSRQQCANGKIQPIKKIVLLSEIGKLLVLCGSTVSAFTLPELSPDNIGKVKGVSDITVDWDQIILDSKGRNYIAKIDHIAGDVFVKVTLLTSKYIRLVRVFNDGIRLYKDVNYPNSLVGIQKSASTVVASLTDYDLVDVEHSQKVQLFSTSTPSDDQVKNKFSDNYMNPIIIPVGKDEFLLVCGGCTAKDPAAGVMVNSTGDVTRGTITWMSYPKSVTVDYPYVLATFSGGFVAVHSLQNQKLVQTMRLDDNIELMVKSVCRNFEIRDQNLIKALTRCPIKTQTTPEEIEKIAIESDLAESNLSKSCCLMYDIHGHFVKVFQRLPRPLRWTRLYSDATEITFEQTFDELMDELKEVVNENHSTEWQFLVTLLVLFTLRFHKFDEAFNLLANNIKYVDPRLIVYVHAGKDYKQIYGSVWVANGLLSFVEDLRDQYALPIEQSNSREFIRLYANTCLASKEGLNKTEVRPIIKTIEIYLLNIGLDQKEDLNPVLMSIHYSSTEVIETLLFKKSYYYLSRFYAHQKNYQQCLYYWKGLITSEFHDEIYEKIYKTMNESLNSFIECMLQNCVEKESVIEAYTTWLLEQFPTFGFKVLIDKRADKVEFNEISVLHLLEHEHSDLMVQYLEYVVKQKNKKQFMGDLVLSLLSEILHWLNDDKMMAQLTDLASTYISLSIPKMAFSKFWNLQKKKSVKTEFFTLHDKLYFYLSFINQGTVSILNRSLVLGVCEHRMMNGQVEKVLPLISLMIQLKGGHDEAVLILLCEIGDYRTAEIYASTGELPVLSDKMDSQIERHRTVNQEKSQKLLLILFDKYLHLRNPQLIDSFLDHHNIFENDSDGLPGDITEVLDKFSGIICRIPDDFPLMEIQKFIERSLLKIQEYNDDLLISKALMKSDDITIKKLQKSLQE